MAVEHCPELTETDPRRLAELYEDVTPRMRAVLDLLLARAPERLAFREVEAELGWHRGRFASVFGGFRGARGRHFRRPFRLAEPRFSESGEWELWLDAEMAHALRRARVALALEGGGFVAAGEEAEELVEAAGDDAPRLDALLARRLTGEPLAWITGRVEFCGVEVRVEPGVYVPRWQTERLARRAAERLPERGVAVDLCTGSGAVAKVLASARPEARVLGTDLDERAVACARANGVEALHGDLFAPLPAALHGAVDVVTGVLPYVPRSELPLLQRDTLTFESPLSYDGGGDGTEVLRRAIRDALRFVRQGGALLLEVGGEQADALAPQLDALGYTGVTTLRDEDGDVRGVEATRGGA